jgi:hypothetical protein
VRQVFGMGLLLLIVACGRKADGGDTTAAKADTGGMSGMTMMSGAMMDSMTAHMRSMDTASAPTIQAMMPMHRQMAANMVAQMNSEMRSMNMQGDARWSALMDSVRQDFVRMPEMNAQQLKAFIPAHHGRLTRLIESHRGMMKM